MASALGTLRPSLLVSEESKYVGQITVWFFLLIRVYLLVHVTFMCVILLNISSRMMKRYLFDLMMFQSYADGEHYEPLATSLSLGI